MGYKDQVLCEFMQEICCCAWPVCLVPTCFLLVDFTCVWMWLVAALVHTEVLWRKSVLCLAILALWSICIVFRVKFHFLSVSNQFYWLKVWYIRCNLNSSSVWDVRYIGFDICEARNLTFCLRETIPVFATCMYMLERAVSIFATIDFD